MSRILVTGAGGFVGTTLVPELLRRGYSVRAFDRFFFGRNLLPVHDRLEVIRDDTRRISPDVFTDVDCVIDLVSLSNDALGEYFDKATWEINYLSRKRTARLAKAAGVGRYILGSSCSVYGFQKGDAAAREDGPTNPQTTYANAAEKAEQGILPLADSNFCVVVLRQSTLFGDSPRMRFDLVVNAMTYSAWESGKISVRRDGTQWRPLLHVRDDVAAICMMLEIDAAKVSGQVFNVGSSGSNYQLMQIAEAVAQVAPHEVEIKWFLEPDNRSYRVDFAKIEALGYKAEITVKEGAKAIFEQLQTGKTRKLEETISLDYLQKLQKLHDFIKKIEMHGGIVDLPGVMREDGESFQDDPIDWQQVKASLGG